MRIGASVRNGNIGVTGFTMTLRTKNRKRRNTGAIVVTIRMTAATITSSQRTNVEALAGLVEETDNIGTNDDMTRAPTMIVIRNPVRTKFRHGITAASTKIKRSKRKGTRRP